MLSLLKSSNLLPVEVFQEMQKPNNSLYMNYRVICWKTGLLQSLQELNQILGLLWCQWGNIPTSCLRMTELKKDFLQTFCPIVVKELISLADT